MPKTMITWSRSAKQTAFWLELNNYFNELKRNSFTAGLASTIATDAAPISPRLKTTANKAL